MAAKEGRREDGEGEKDKYNKNIDQLLQKLNNTFIGFHANNYMPNYFIKNK